MSLPFDRRLAADDIVGSRAHVARLGAGQVLTADEAAGSCSTALDRVGDELAEGTFVFAPGDEDIHTAIERRVTEIAGDDRRQAPHRTQPQRPGRHRAAAVHEARAASRSPRASSSCSACCSTGADEAGDAYLPGYTHLQRAQPVLLAPPPARPRVGACAATSTACSTPAGARRVAARRRRAGRVVAAARSRQASAADLGFARGSRTRSTP